MAYSVVLRRNGAKVGYFGPFGTKKQAIAQGQVLADDSARDVVVSVEPQRKKATTKKKRTNTRTTRKNTAYIRKSARAGTMELVAALNSNISNIKHGNGGDIRHAEQQVRYLAAAGAIRPRDRDMLLHKIDTKHDRFPVALERNPGRGTFQSKTYAYYTVADGKLTSGHGSPTGTPSAKRKARAEAKKRASRPENVMTAKQAQKYVGRSLTSSASWYNRSR